MTTPQVAHTPVFIDPDAFVLDGHELREGIELGTTSRFGDGIWDLHPINHQDQLVRSILNFPTLPEPFRAVAKELFYALLVGELPPGEARLKQVSIRIAFSHVKKFLDWAHTRGRCTLAAMTREDLVDYQQWVLLTDLSPTQRGMHRRAARLFWVFRDALHTDRLTVDPQRLQAWHNDSSHPPRRIENATDRIPEEVISPCWCGRCGGSTTSATTSSPPVTNGGRSTSPAMQWISANPSPADHSQHDSPSWRSS